MFKKLGVLFIKFYQKFISPLLGSNKCRYTPTCSQYAIEAVTKHGLIKGAMLSLWRILRCNPFSKGGLDKVPDKKSVIKWVL